MRGARPVLGAAVAERPGARRAPARAAGGGPRPRARLRLALPSVVAARTATVLATNGHTDAVAFAAHVLAINEVEGEVAHVDWAEHGEQLVERGPWDLVLAADVLYTSQNVNAASRLFHRLVAPTGALIVADPNRKGAQGFLASARATFELVSARGPEVSLHTLTPRNG